MAEDQHRCRHTTRAASPAPRPAYGQRAFDPFFVFTYALLALAGAIQVFLMVWMDLF